MARCWVAVVGKQLAARRADVMLTNNVACQLWSVPWSVGWHCCVAPGVSGLSVLTSCLLELIEKLP